MNREFKLRSTLGRGIDLRYPSNRYIAAVGLGILITVPLVALLSRKALDTKTIGGAVQFSLTAFVAWAIGRELDPDFAFTSYVVTPLAIVAAIIWEPPAILALAGAMMAVRVVNRSVGPRFSDLDGLALIGSVGLLAFLGHPIVGLGIAVGIGLNQFLPNPDQRRAVIAAGLAIVATIIATVLALPFDIDWQLDYRLILAGIPIVILYGYAIRLTPIPLSVSDIGKKPLNRQRIMAGQMLALLIALAVLVVFGNDGLQKLSGLWAAFIAMGLRPIYQHFALAEQN